MTTHITINNTVPRIRYISNGVLATYTYPFAIFKNSDLKVYFGSTLQEASTYSVSGAGQSSGGIVTLSNIPAGGTIITLTRELTIERTTDFQEGGTLRADTLNHELDYQIACQQQIADNLNRSMVLPPYAADNNLNLTLPLPSAGKAIVWNSSGTNLESSTVAINELESTLNGYKTAAETAAITATSKAEIASDKADIATIKAAEASSILSSKANKDMDNLSSAGKKAVSNLPMASSSYLDLTLGASGGSYIAPANGWINLIKVTTSNNQYVALYNMTADGLGCTSSPAVSGGRCICLLPVSINDEIVYNYSAAGDTVRFRFYYAQGEL